MSEYTFPVLCLLCLWLLILAEWGQHKWRSKAAQRPAQKQNWLDGWNERYFPLHGKVAVTALLTVVVLVILLYMS